MHKLWKKGGDQGVRLEPLNHSENLDGDRLISDLELVGDGHIKRQMSDDPGRAKGETSAETRRRRGIWVHVKAWGPEIVWSLLSTAVFIALVVTLSQYQGRPMQQWKFGLTLNTLVAFLSTICRSMTVIPIAEGLSQLKWNWIAVQHRPIRDLYAFDQASRGPFGSLKLIAALRGRFISYGTIASLVMVSGLFTSFLTQSAISYENVLSLKNKPGANIVAPTAPAALSYPQAMLESAEGDERSVVDSISRAAFQGALRAVNEPWPSPNLNCQTKDCGWDEFSSLAVCTSIRNISDSLVLTKLYDEKRDGSEAWKAELPDGAGNLFVNNRQPAVTNMSSPEPNITYTNNKWPYERNFIAEWENKDLQVATFSQFFILYNNFGSKNSIGLRGAEVLWHFCVNKYNVGVQNGTSSTRISSSTTRVQIVEPGSSDGEVQSSFTLLSEDGKSSFNVSDGNAYSNLDLNFREGFGGPGGPNLTPQLSFNYQMGLNMYIQSGYDASAIAHDDLPPEDHVEKKTWENLEIIVNTIADAMTGYLREANPKGSFDGQAFEQQAHVVIRWEWLSLLAVQVGLTILFLVVVIIHTAMLDMDVVKSSNIAEMFAMHGKEGESWSAENRETDRLQAIGVNTKVGKDVTARLTKRSYGWKMNIA